MDPENKKFSESEMLIGGLFFLGLDGLCFLLELTAVGALPAVFIQIFANVLMNELWFKNKGVDNGKFLKQFLKYLGSAAPSGNFWVFLVSAVAHNHPRAIKIGAQVAGAALGGVAGAKIGAAVGEYATGGSLRESIRAGVTSGGTIPKNL